VYVLMSKNSLVVGNESLVVVIPCVQPLASCLIYDIDVLNFRGWERSSSELGIRTGGLRTGIEPHGSLGEVANPHTKQAD
jgi:hypothetical protein